MTLDPAVAALRVAVRRHVGRDGSGPQLVACSGGADSLALLAACVFEAHKAERRVIGVVVDHGLQAGSSDHTARVVEQMATLGVDETASIRVTVDPGPAGIEAGAREARYAALGRLSQHFGAAVVHLGHTLDDQAETVLLGLARGSGGRSLQGMRPSFEEDGVTFVRPLLGVRRAQTEAACRAQGITWWSDPHNDDPGYARVRVRQTVLPVLERELGPGIAEALARTGEQLREDMDLIEPLARDALARAATEDGLDVLGLDAMPTALATRVVRAAAVRAGAVEQELTRAHVLAVLRLSGQAGKQVQLPGHLTATVRGERLVFRSTRPGTS